MVRIAKYINSILPPQIIFASVIMLFSYMVLGFKTQSSIYSTHYKYVKRNCFWKKKYSDIKIPLICIVSYDPGRLLQIIQSQTDMQACVCHNYDLIDATDRRMTGFIETFYGIGSDIICCDKLFVMSYTKARLYSKSLQIHL